VGSGADGVPMLSCMEAVAQTGEMARFGKVVGGMDVNCALNGLLSH
jgi:hypothetical protein